MLTSPSDVPGRANADFVIFPPRWMVGEDTFRPPWFHRNVMSEAMGLIHGAYDAKAEGFAPGGLSLHNLMSGHGPDVDSWRKASEAELKPVKIEGTMAFMVETCWPYRPTQWALDRAQPDYDEAWAGFPEGEAAVIDSSNDPALISWCESARAATFRSRTCRSAFSRLASGGGGRASRSAITCSTSSASPTCSTRIGATICRSPCSTAGWRAGPTRSGRSALRLIELLSDERYRDDVEPQLVGQSEVRLHVPCLVGDYTDFYVGIHHATNVGKQFRPDNPLLPNYKYVPIGYHGRASSVRASGEPVIRPNGQRKAPDAETPEYGPSRRLDYELELGIWVGEGNELGSPIPIGEAAEHIAGYCLLNDWSARDLQAWEYQPLGPFLAKNFLTSVSPWVVSPQALEPFRKAMPPRPAGDPEPLPYLDDEPTAKRAGSGSSSKLR